MAEDIGSLVVKIEADLSNFQNGLNNVSNKMDNFGSTVKKIGATIIGAFAVDKIVGFFKSAIDDAGKAQETMAQLNAVLKSTGGVAGVTAESAIKLAEGLSNVTTYSKGSVLGAENMLLTFTNIGKSVFPQATTAVLNMSTALGQDLKSSSIQLGKALNDPVAGVTALQRVGVKLTEAQKEQIKSFIAVGNVTAAQKVILKELDTEFGNSAAMAGQTYPGKLAILSNKFEEVKKSIGEKLIPILFDMLTWFSAHLPEIQKFVTDAFTIISNFLKENMPKIQKFATDAFNEIIKVIGFLKDNAGLLIPILAGVTTAILAQMIISTLTPLYEAWKAATVTMTTVQWLFNAALDANPIGLVAVAIGALVAIGIVLYRNWDIIKTKALALWDSIKQTFSNLSSFFQAAWNSTIVILKNAWNGVVLFFTNLWVSIKTATINAWNSIKLFFTNIWNGIVNGISSIVTNFISSITEKFHKQIGDISVIFAGLKIIFENIWEVIKNIFLGAVLLLIDLVTLNFTKLKEDAGHIFENLKDLFINIWENIKNIFRYALEIIILTLSQAWAAIKNIAETAWNGIKTFFTNLWVNIKTTALTAWTDFKTWISNFWKNIIQDAQNIWNGLIDWFKALPGKLYDLAVSMFTRMKDGTTSTISGIKDAIVNGLTKAIDWIKNLPKEALQWGEDIINGIVNGIKNAAKAVGDAVNGIAQDIRNFLHFSVPDEGPLADFESWMPDFMKGLANGINNSKGVVKTAINGLSKDISIGMTASVPINTGANSGNKPMQNKGQSINYDGMFRGSIFNVRSDNDIKMIAREIYNIQTSRGRSLGIIPVT